MIDRMKLDSPAYHQSLKAAEEIKRLREELAAARAVMKEARHKISAAFINRRVDCDVAIFTHSMVLDAIYDIDAALKDSTND